MARWFWLCRPCSRGLRFDNLVLPVGGEIERYRRQRVSRQSRFSPVKRTLEWRSAHLSQRRAIREFTRLPQSAGFQGWNSTHTCVTAAAASLRGLKQLPQLRYFLQRVRMLDGGWSGYWWVSRAYPTLLAAEALGVGMSPWAERCPDSSSFGLACRLAMGAPVEAQVMSLQRVNGSWQGSAQLRIPEPQVTRPAQGRCRITVDQNHIYTTATAIRGLHEAG